NYSCEQAAKATDAPTPLGAVADLYNATCTTGFLGDAVTNKLTNNIAQQDQQSNLAQNLIRSGQHYFPDNTTPVFNLNTAKANYGITFTKKNASIPAPADASTSQDKSAAVPWLKLKVQTPPPTPYQLDAKDSASNVAEIYRLNTAGGAQPTCDGYMGRKFQKQYAAEYWFWH
ncbi:MAG: hypothetical protein Q9217_002995, partial [Psora testacea]